jgi:hypothetical protein
LPNPRLRESGIGKAQVNDAFGDIAMQQSGNRSEFGGSHQ